MSSKWTTRKGAEPQGKPGRTWRARADTHPRGHTRTSTCPDAPTLLQRRVGVGQEAEVALVVPADQGHVALGAHAVLAARRGRGRAGQHGLRQPRAVALARAEQAAAVDPWRAGDGEAPRSARRMRGQGRTAHPGRPLRAGAGAFAPALARARPRCHVGLQCTTREGATAVPTARALAEPLAPSASRNFCTPSRPHCRRETGCDRSWAPSAGLSRVQTRPGRSPDTDTGTGPALSWPHSGGATKYHARGRRAGSAVSGTRRVVRGGSRVACTPRKCPWGGRWAEAGRDRRPLNLPGAPGPPSRAGGDTWRPWERHLQPETRTASPAHLSP